MNSKTTTTYSRKRSRTKPSPPRTPSPEAASSTTLPSTPRDLDALEDLSKTLDLPKISPSIHRTGILAQLHQTRPASPSILSRSRSLGDETSPSKQRVTTPTRSPQKTLSIIQQSPSKISPQSLRTYSRSRSYLASLNDRDTNRGSFSSMQSRYAAEEEDSNDLQGVHTLREHGESSKFRDEVEYILEGLDPDASYDLQLSSAVEIVNKLLAADFVRRLTANGLLAKVQEMLTSLPQLQLQLRYCWLLSIISLYRANAVVEEDGLVEAVLDLLPKSLTAESPSPDLHKVIVKMFHRKTTSLTTILLTILDTYMCNGDVTSRIDHIRTLNGVTIVSSLLASAPPPDQVACLDVLETLTSHPQSTKDVALSSLAKEMRPVLRSCAKEYDDPFASSKCKDCIDRIFRILVNLTYLQEDGLDLRSEEDIYRTAMILFQNELRNGHSETLIFALGLVGTAGVARSNCVAPLCPNGHIGCIDGCNCGQEVDEMAYMQKRYEEMQAAAETSREMQSLLPYMEAIVNIAIP